MSEFKTAVGVGSSLFVYFCTWLPAFPEKFIATPFETDLNDVKKQIYCFLTEETLVIERHMYNEETQPNVT